MTRHFQIKSGRRQHQPWPGGLCLDTHGLPLATQGLRWASGTSDEESQGRMGTPGKGLKRLKKNLLVFCLIVKICARGRELGKWRTRRKRKQARAVDPDSRFSFILQIKCPHGSGSTPGQPHSVPGCALGLPPLTPCPQSWLLSCFRLSSNSVLGDLPDPCLHPSYLAWVEFFFFLEFTSVCNCLISLFVGWPPFPGIYLRALPQGHRVCPSVGAPLLFLN